MADAAITHGHFDRVRERELLWEDGQKAADVVAPHQGERLHLESF
jgi:hypothetical protein